MLILTRDMNNDQISQGPSRTYKFRFYELEFGADRGMEPVWQTHTCSEITAGFS